MLCHSLKQINFLASHVLAAVQSNLISVVIPKEKQQIASRDLY